jgi:hypothetical protein
LKKISELRNHGGGEMTGILGKVRLRKKRSLRFAIFCIALSSLLFFLWVLGFGCRLFIDSKSGSLRSSSAECFFTNKFSDQRGGIEVVWSYGTGNPRTSRVRGFLIPWTLGFVGGIRYPNDAGVNVMTITDISYWPFITVFFLFALLFYRHFQRIAHPRGRCEACNYDLRAHQPGQKCPECGTEIPRFGWRPPAPPKD